MKKNFVFITFIFIILFFSISCKKTTFLTLLTDRPEVKYYVELFNTEQDKIKINTIYNKDAGDKVYNSLIKPDIVIAENLNTKLYISNYRKVSNLLNRGKVSQSKIYPNLLKACKYDKQTLLLPLSFDLNLIIFKKGALDSSDFYIDSKTIYENSKEFTYLNRGKNILKYGFSFFWEPLTFSQLLEFKSVNFTDRKSDVVYFNSENLISSIENISKYKFNDKEKIIKFRNKYTYDTPYNLIVNDRVKFKSIKLTDYMKLNLEQKSKIDYKFYGENNSILTLNNITFIGITKRSKKVKESEAFIKWLYRDSTQKKLIYSSKKGWLNTFGLNGKLSSIPRSNELYIANLYPELATRIPDETIIKAPLPKPIIWESLKSDIIAPWIEDAIYLDKEIDTKILKENISKWIKQTSIN